MKNKMKRIASVMMLVLLLVGMIGEAMPSMAASVKTKSIRLSASGTLTLNLKETLTLTATLTPAESTQKVTWSSSNKKIARVSGGVVSGVRTGTVKITATSGTKKASVKVKVVDPGKPTSVSLNPGGSTSMFVGNNLQLTATLAPATAWSGLKWKSSNKKVATVDANGLVFARSPGTATITVTTRNKKKAKVKIRTIDDGKQPIVPPAGYDKPYVLYACIKSHTIAAIAKDDNGEWTRVVRMWPTGTGREKGTTDAGFWWLTKKEAWHKWGSGYSPFACKLSIGIYLHGPIYKKKNRSTIRYDYYNCIGTNCSSGCLRTVCGCAQWVYYNCPVGTYCIVAQNSRFSTARPTKIGKKAKTDPTDMGDNVEIFMTGFSTNVGSVAMGVGATQPIVPSNFAPANTSTTTFTYTTDNPGVAVVDANGNVTGVGAGSATITVTANDDYGAHVRIPVTITGGDDSAKVAEASDIVIPDFTEITEIMDAADSGLTVEEIPAEDTASTDETASGEDIASSEDTASTEESASAEETAEVADAVIIAGTVDEEVGAASGEDFNGLTAENESVDAEITEIIVEE